MVAHPYYRKDIRHGDFEGPSMVEGQRDVDRKLTDVKKRRREGRGKEAELVLRPKTITEENKDPLT